MNITFWGTTIQIVVRVVGAYLLVGRLGLDAVALATGLGLDGHRPVPVDRVRVGASA